MASAAKAATLWLRVRRVPPSGTRRWSFYIFHLSSAHFFSSLAQAALPPAVRKGYAFPACCPANSFLFGEAVPRRGSSSFPPDDPIQVH